MGSTPPNAEHIAQPVTEDDVRNFAALVQFGQHPEEDLDRTVERAGELLVNEFGMARDEVMALMSAYDAGLE